MQTIIKLKEAINKANNIILLTHVGPDGDALGSLLAMKEILNIYAFDKNVDAVITGRCPDVYAFLPGINEVKRPNDESLLSSYDLAISLDCAALDRFGDCQNIFKNAKASINIDHHVSNPNFADINIVEKGSASTGQIIFNLLESLNIEITKSIATNLYTSIITDTGGLRFNNTTSETMLIAAELLKTGIDHSEIFKACFECKPLSMVMLKATAIKNAKFGDKNKIAYTTVSRALLNELGASDDHVDGISEALRQINTVEVAMVFKETPKGDTKVSFRSNGVDVCRIAEFFGGGGHKLAAGCTIQKSIEDSIKELLPITKKEVKQYSKHKTN